MNIESEIYKLKQRVDDLDAADTELMWHQQDITKRLNERLRALEAKHGR